MRTIAFCALFNVTQPASGKDCRENTGESDAKTQIPENTQTLVVGGASTPQAPGVRWHPIFIHPVPGEQDSARLLLPPIGVIRTGCPQPAGASHHRARQKADSTGRCRKNPVFPDALPSNSITLDYVLEMDVYGTVQDCLCSLQPLCQMALPRSPQLKPHQQSTTGAHSCHKASNSFPSRF